MPHYVDDPDNPGKKISSIELQKRCPNQVRPPVLIHDWMKRDLWNHREAVQLLAGWLPLQNCFDVISPRGYLDGTCDQQLLWGDIPPKGWPDNIDPAGNYPRLKHPLRDEIMQNLLRLQDWVEHCDLDETKSPQSWIDWAGEKGFKPYWLKYIEAIQSASVANVEAIPVISQSVMAIPGKIPKTTIGRLAITAAWQIECETRKHAKASDVISRLQSWADSDDHPELQKKIPHGVSWLTKKAKENDYDVGACEKTLATWNKSRS